MNSGALDAHWVRTWAADVDAHLRTVLAAFDDYYPFPPGDNEVVLAGPERGAVDALRARPEIAADLVTFYEVVEEVIMSDIGNAFFVHAPEDVAARLAEGPVDVGAGTGVVFASNGGGILYAVGADGRVHRTLVASVDGGFEPVAGDLRGFLAHVRAAVAHFVETKDPGDL